MVEKNFLPPENHDTPKGKNYGPSYGTILKVLKFSASLETEFVTKEQQ